MRAQVGIRANMGQFQVVFEGVRGNSYLGDIAIDDVALQPGMCGTTSGTYIFIFLNPAFVAAYLHF